jgi:sugar phosphate isomerase/epimerase
MNLLTWAEGRILESGHAWAELAEANLVTAAPGEFFGTGAPRVVTRSGWLDRVDEEPAPSWTSGPRARFEHAMESIVPIARERGTLLLIRPSAGDMISDIPSSLGMLRKWAGQPVGLLLEPAALFTGSMLGHAEDHLQRIGETLGEHPSTAAIFISNVVFDDGAARRVPIGDGRIPEILLRDFAAAVGAAGKPVVCLGEDLERIQRGR